MIIFAFDVVENIVGKGENAGYQLFLLFPQCFDKAFFTAGSLKSRDCVVELTLYHTIPTFNDPEEEAF